MTNYIALATLSLLAGGATAADLPAASGTTRYVQAASGNSLAFTFTQLGAASTGHFKTFTTELQFDQANLAQSALLVRVVIDSLDTQDAERDGTLVTADLFDAKAHPAATFVARSLVRNASGGLEALGRLTIRGVGRDLRLPITLKPTAKGFELSGEASIKRLDFGVGQGEWKSTESVGDDVRIQYQVALEKAAK